MSIAKKYLLIIPFILINLFCYSQLSYDYLPLPVFSTSDLNVKGNVKSILERRISTDDGRYEHDFKKSFNTVDRELTFTFTNNNSVKDFRSRIFSKSRGTVNIEQKEFGYRNDTITKENYQKWHHDLTSYDSADRAKKRKYERKKYSYRHDAYNLENEISLYDSASASLVKILRYDNDKKLISVMKIDSVSNKYSTILEDYHYTQESFLYNSNKQVEKNSLKTGIDDDILGKSMFQTEGKLMEEYKTLLKEIQNDPDATVFKYNQNGDVDKIYYYEKGKKYESLDFSYTYDEKGNWIKCIIEHTYAYKEDRENEAKYTIIARKINYD